MNIEDVKEYLERHRKDCGERYENLSNEYADKERELDLLGAEIREIGRRSLAYKAALEALEKEQHEAALTTFRTEAV